MVTKKLINNEFNEHPTEFQKSNGPPKVAYKFHYFPKDLSLSSLLLLYIEKKLMKMRTRTEKKSDLYMYTTKIRK